MAPLIRIASPCPANWEKMAGDDRVRYCPECQLNVYNFSAMKPAEIERIVAQREGRLCAGFYQRADGTMLTSNCPVGWRAAFWRATRVASATLAALMSLRPSMAQSTPKSGSQPQAEVQNAKRGLSLKLVDPTGAAISEGQITITNQATRAITKATPNSLGEIELPELPQGTYQVAVQIAGFEAASQLVAVPSGATVEIQVFTIRTMGEVIVLHHRNPVTRFFHRIREIV